MISEETTIDKISQKNIYIIDFPLPAFLDSQNNLKLIQSYNSPSLIQRLKFRIFNTLGIRFNYKISENKLDKLSNADVVIVFDSLKNYSEVCDTVTRIVSSDTLLIMYLWNPVSHSQDFKKLNNRWKICSFSKNDSDKYGFKFVDTFYNPNLAINYNQHNCNGNVFFIGTDKGRFNLLQKIKLDLENRSISTDFRIVDNFKRLFNSNYSKGISYDKVCRLISESIALLEITQSRQQDPTLRSLESIYFKKKLITNNIDIKKRPFYSPNNIFILGEKDIDTINEFLNSPYDDLTSDIKEYYTFNCWLKRIIEF